MAESPPSEPPSDEEKEIASLIASADPALLREQERQSVVEESTGSLTAESLNASTEAAHTAIVDGARAQRNKFRLEYRNRVREEEVAVKAGSPVSGYPSRVILGQLMESARRVSSAERARARFRAFARTVDNIDALKLAFDSTPVAPPLPKLKAFESYVAARVEAGMATKGQLREIRQQIADLE